MVGDDIGSVRDIEQIQGPAMDWARQTIAFALAIREEEIGQPLNTTQLAELASGEAQTTAQELWRAALQECGLQFEPWRVATLFARQVLDWAANHRSSLNADSDASGRRLPR
jgi:hypothetical protein